MASSSWSSRLQNRLSSLADNASRESVQTLSKWMAFNRKHGQSFATALMSSISSAPSPSRMVLYLSVAHEVLIAESGPGLEKKWERLAEFRSVLGETVVVPSAECIRSAATGGDGGDADVERVRAMAEKWEELDAFGGPTIIDALSKVLSREVEDEKSAVPNDTGDGAGSAGDGAGSASEDGVKGESKVAESATTAEKVEAQPADAVEEGSGAAKSTTTAIGTSTSSDTVGTGTASQKVGTEAAPLPKKADDEQKQPPVATSVSRENDEKDPGTVTVTEAKPEESSKESKSGAVAQEVESQLEEKDFDFESQGIPYGKVDAKDFLVPCKSIATMQIARELRNDTAVQLSSILSSAPPEVEEACKAALRDAAADGEKKPKVDLASLPPLSDEILDLDVDDALNNVKLFKDIIMKQRQARQTCIDLLIKSRCRFGSTEAAEAFYSMKAKAERLRKRKEMLSDAMALEGLDFEGEPELDQAGRDEDELKPFPWYNAESQPEAKRARVS